VLTDFKEKHRSEAELFSLRTVLRPSVTMGALWKTVLLRAFFGEENRSVCP